MKTTNLNRHWFHPVLLTLGAALLAGCATRAGYKQADWTGDAINDLRGDVVNIKFAVDASMKALDDLAAAATSDPRKPYETFARTVAKVEKATATANKHADKMRDRGASYFEQWENEISSVKNEEMRKLAQERRAKLQETFNNIKTATEETRQTLPPYLSDLKDLRTVLSADLTVQGLEAAKGVFQKSKEHGAAVQKTPDSLVMELNSVATITAAKT
jgi:hypothetical protein